MPARRIVVGYTLKLVIGSFKKEALSALSTLQEERRRGTDTFILLHAPTFAAALTA